VYRRPPRQLLKLPLLELLLSQQLLRVLLIFV
jgi:hypothetical protein